MLAARSSTAPGRFAHHPPPRPPPCVRKHMCNYVYRMLVCMCPHLNMTLTVEMRCAVRGILRPSSSLSIAPCPAYLYTPMMCCLTSCSLLCFIPEQDADQGSALCCRRQGQPQGLPPLLRDQLLIGG